MGKVIEFQNVGDIPIELKKSEEYITAVNVLSAHIAELRLASSENNRLVELAVSLVKQAKRDAFLQGFRVGLKIAKDDT